jgi:UDP-hydrolysing UDP-N-acetyl-D-glucosamine 2-epimerase
MRGSTGDSMADQMRLLVVTGTRADFGLWMPVLREARRRKVDAELLVTAMHLDPRFGDTAREVRAFGTPVAAEVPCTPDGDGLVDMATALGVALQGMAPVIDAGRPTWLLLLGDRGEQAAAALAALHMGTPVAHLHGGEVSHGAVDDTLRDVISRVAHLHLVATPDAAQRLTAMGEEPWRIRQVGAPGLDDLRSEAQGDLGGLRQRYGLGEGAYLLIVQHPETVGTRGADRDMEQTLAAAASTSLPVLAIHPNADAGGRAMSDVLARSTMTSVASLPRPEFVTLLAGAAAIVGNSSSGIIEAPLLAVPAVNVGERQAGRTRGDNVIDVTADADAIAAAIRVALGPSFRARLSRTSPYGDGGAAPRILDALQQLAADPRLPAKRVGRTQGGR